MKWIVTSSFLLYAFVLTVWGVPLYSPTDRIALLENDTISSTIYNSPVAWFVEFYSSWCGHCQSFAPSWKQLALEVEGWSKVIRIAAIDCAEKRNFRTCENFSIQGYPSLRFFEAYTKSKSDVGLSYDGERTALEMRHGIIDFFEDGGLRKSKKIHINFTPQRTKMSDKHYKEKPRTQQLALVFEKNTSYFGRELILDLMNNRKITVKRIVDDEAGQKKYNVTKLPQVVLVDKNNNFHLLKETKREKVLLELKSFHVVTKTPPTPQAIVATNEHFSEIHQNDTFSVNSNSANFSIVYMQDLEGALSSIFRQEIVRKPVIDKKIVKDFVGLLVECFPGRPPVNNFLKALHKWLERQPQKITRDTMRLFYAMHQADPEVVLPDEIQWQLCQGSTPQYRGYPCSLWLLFHTLTVNCATRHVAKFTGADVLLRIRGYVTNFFGCLECGRHFAAMSQNVSSEVHSLDGAVLWLWNAHNRVNQRLSKEPSTDPKFPKIIYPPIDLCSDCISYNGTQASWRTDVVIEFLKVHYGVHNILLNDKYETETDRKKFSENVRFIGGGQLVQVVGFGINQFDASLCVIVYGAGVVILVTLYIYILRRRRRRYKHQSHMA